MQGNKSQTIINSLEYKVYTYTVFVYAANPPFLIYPCKSATVYFCSMMLKNDKNKQFDIKKKSLGSQELTYLTKTIIPIFIAVISSVFPIYLINFVPFNKGQKNPEIEEFDIRDKLHPILLGDHGKKITSISFSSDSKYLASSSSDDTIMLWNLDDKELNEKELKEVAVFDANDNKKITSISFTPDGKYLASSSSDSKIRLWNLETKKTIVVLKWDKDKEITSVTFSPDGKKLILESRNDIVKTINLVEFPLDGK